MTQNVRLHALMLAFAAFASSCSGCLGCSSPVNADGSNLPSACQSTSPLIQPAKLDVLFLIDNSSSMIEEQQGVASELTSFITELKKGGGVSTDFHVGVVTSSVYQHTKINGVEFLRQYPGQSGRLQPVPDLGPDGGVVLGTGTERVLEGTDPDLVAKFSRLVQQGVQGSGQETPYEAIRLAVTDLDKIPLENGGNGGFLRDGARLLVVVLSDEDDCSEMTRPPKVAIGDNPAVDDCLDQAASLTTVNDYKQIYDGLTDSLGSKREVIWTEIAPVSTINKMPMAVTEGGQVRNLDCHTSNAPGFRHYAMCQAWDPSLANLDSICRPSYKDTLLAIASLANISQSIEILNVPDPRMLQVSITRADNAIQVCTLSSGLEKYQAPHDQLPGKIFFGPDCRRRADDLAIEVKMLCVL